MQSEAAEVHLLPPAGSIGCRGYPLLSVHDDGPQLGGSVGGQTRCVCIHPTVCLVPIQEHPFILGHFPYHGHLHGEVPGCVQVLPQNMAVM